VNEKLRIALIGLDHWYSAISLAESLARHDDIDFVGIADSNESHLREVADKVGVENITTDLMQFINDPDVDVIASFVTVDRNPEMVIAAARAGKHILSVKPLARTLEEATRIVEAVREAGVVFIPSESRSRQTEQNQHLKRIVNGGTLGKIVSGNFTLIGSLPQGWPGGPADGGWWADPARVPGGGWVDHAIYQIDRLRWLLGERVVSVSGRTANLVHTDIDVEDYGHAILEFEGGAVVSIEDTWSAPAGSWRITSVLVGTNGALNIDTLNQQMSVFRAGDHPGWTSESAPPDNSDLVQPLIDQITGHAETSLGTVEDAWENLAISIAFYEAAASGTAVRPAQLKSN
jgi:predicted dehydrogenase